MTVLAWAVPLGIAVAVLIPIAFALAQLVDEVSRLRHEVRTVAALRPVLAEIGRDVRAGRRTVEQLRHR